MKAVGGWPSEGALCSKAQHPVGAQRSCHCRAPGETSPGEHREGPAWNPRRRRGLPSNYSLLGRMTRSHALWAGPGMCHLVPQRRLSWTFGTAFAKGAEHGFGKSAACLCSGSVKSKLGPKSKII